MVRVLLSALGMIDFQIEVVALAAGFVAEFGAGVVGDVFDVEEQSVVQAARAGVLDGNVAVDAVPGAADELEGDVFGDVDGAAGHDYDFGEEFFEVAIFGGRLARRAPRQEVRAKRPLSREQSERARMTSEAQAVMGLCG